MSRRTAVFLIHPRDHRDLVERFGWTRVVPPFVTDPLMWRLSGRLGHTICETVDVNGEVEFHLLAVLLKGRQMVTSASDRLKWVQARIHASALHAQDVLGADVIGLGALTASVTSGGRALVRRGGLTSALTHGDAFTVSTSLDGVRRACQLADLAEPVVAIVGATGLIGSGLAHRLAEEHELLLVGRSERKLERLVASLPCPARTTTSLEDLRAADLVVTATSHPGALLAPEHLKAGAIVYDVSQPANADRELLRRRPDVVRIDGGLVETPGLHFRFDMRTAPGATFACLAETLLMAFEGIGGQHVGAIDPTHVETLERIAARRGFRHAPFTEFGRPLTPADFQARRALAKNPRPSSAVVR